MKFFIDSADIDLIKEFLAMGLCHGVTTNPSIMKRDGVSSRDGMIQRQLAIAELIAPLPLSVEVGSDEPEEIVRQAEEFVKRLPNNIMVKVTVINRSGQSLLEPIYRLASGGIAINCTAILTQNQAMLAAVALETGRLKYDSTDKRVGSPCQVFNHIVSIFAGRISEEHGVHHASEVIRGVRTWLDLHSNRCEIIVGSVRSAENVQAWALTGAHILTVPPEVISKCFGAARGKETVTQFLNDYQSSILA